MSSYSRVNRLLTWSGFLIHPVYESEVVYHIGGYGRNFTIARANNCGKADAGSLAGLTCVRVML